MRRKSKLRNSSIIAEYFAANIVRQDYLLTRATKL